MAKNKRCRSGERTRPTRLRQLIKWSLLCLGVSILSCGRYDPPANHSFRPSSHLSSNTTRSASTGIANLDNHSEQLQPLHLFTRSPFHFVDMTESSGVFHQYENGEQGNYYTILESLGGGIAIFDYDKDGKLDVLLASGGLIQNDKVAGLPPRLFRQTSPWKFVDVTEQVGLDAVDFYNHGFAISDYDQDGWPDVIVTGYGRLALLRNRNGNLFVDVTREAGLDVPRGETHWSTIAVWADWDGDGDRDLFVGHYVDWKLADQPICRGYGPNVSRDICPPNRFAPLSPQLFFQNGDGTFLEAGSACGLLPGKALGAVVADWNGDGWLDLYVAHDAVHNHFYLNQGTRTFQEEGLLRGVAGNAFGEPDGSMGVACIDLDGNGLLSLAVTNYQGQWHALYRNRGQGWFDYATTIYGWGRMGTNHVGWGIVFADFDLDADEDGLIVQGHVIRHPPAPQALAQAVHFLVNEATVAKPQAFFGLVVGDGYFALPHRARAVATADLDDDGQVDLVITHIGQPTRMFRNVTRKNVHGAQTAANWWGIDLRRLAGRDHTGWQVHVTDEQNRSVVRTITAGDGYLAVHDSRLILGLGSASSLREVQIVTTDRRRWRLPASMLNVNQYHHWDYRDSN